MTKLWNRMRDYKYLYEIEKGYGEQNRKRRLRKMKMI